MQFPCCFGEKCLLNDNVNVVYFFLSDSTTRPSDLPLNVIVQSGNSRAVKSKVVLQMVPPHLCALGRNENRPRPLPLTTMLNPFFFSQNRALNAFSMASGRARPSMLSSYVIGRIRTSYGFGQGIFCQDG